VPAADLASRARRGLLHLRLAVAALELQVGRAAQRGAHALQQLAGGFRREARRRVPGLAPEAGRCLRQFLPQLWRDGLVARQRFQLAGGFAGETSESGTVAVAGGPRRLVEQR
jgi:hypothetical protein